MLHNAYIALEFYSNKSEPSEENRAEKKKKKKTFKATSKHII